MVDGGYDCVWRSKYGGLARASAKLPLITLEVAFYTPRPQLSPAFTIANVQLIVKFRVDDMDFVWVYPDNGSILFVQLRKFPRVPSTFDDIIVELVPERQRCKLWARERGDGTQIQTVCGSIQRVKEYEDSDDLDQRDCIHFTPNASRDN